MGNDTQTNIHCQQVSIYSFYGIVMCVNIKGVFGVDVETEQIEFNYMVNDAKKHVWSSKAKSTVKWWIYNDDSSNNSDISKDYIAALCNSSCFIKKLTFIN